VTRSIKVELTTNDLLSRFWTRTLIKRFLPVPDGNISVDHWANYRGQDIYDFKKVMDIEHSEAFINAFLRSWKGRKKGRMKGKEPKEVLEKLHSQQAKVRGQNVRPNR
jgi:hypothetical protein